MSSSARGSGSVGGRDRSARGAGSANGSVVTVDDVDDDVVDDVADDVTAVVDDVAVDDGSGCGSRRSAWGPGSVGGCDDDGVNDVVDDVAVDDGSRCGNRRSAWGPGSVGGCGGSGSASVGGGSVRAGRSPSRPVFARGWTSCIGNSRRRRGIWDGGAHSSGRANARCETSISSCCCILYMSACIACCPGGL